MALILCLETATTVCSVALAKDGALLSMREVNEGYTHSENLTVFAEQVLQEAGCSFSDIDAIAVSKGPGSYTGLRIGVSAAKGFCFALDKPLIAINTLRAMASGVADLVDLSLSLSSGEGMSDEEGTGNEVNEERGKYYTTAQYDWNRLIKFAKSNRKNPTFAENILWSQLRAKRLGYKFRRQHPVDKFIPDFICLEKRLIVEVDGITHIGREQQDASRTKRLEALGYKVIRFTDDEVKGELDRVLEEIKKALLSAGNSTDTSLSAGDATTNNSLSHGEGRGEVREPHASYGPQGYYLCPMIDARRMEVYCAIYDEQGNEIRPTAAEIIDELSFADVLAEHKILFFGDGAAKCKEKLGHQANAIFIEDIFPSAEYLVPLAEQKFNEKKFEDVAYFEPYYLKDFVSGPKKNT
jgi:tRNA threonylcarbamoyl adenosine modification protein YeaZ